MYNVFFFKQKTAYEIVDCDWSSDVCSSDLIKGNVMPFVGSKPDVTAMFMKDWSASIIAIPMQL